MAHDCRAYTWRLCPACQLEMKVMGEGRAMRIEPRPVAPGNFKKGRSGRKVDVIVIHISEGSMESLENWFANPAAEVSSHYGVSREGVPVQFVPDADTAYHAGVVKHPTAAIVKERPGVNPNLYSIGIENAGLATEDPTPAQLEVLAALVRELAQTHEIPLSRRHVLGHREINGGKTCPGKIDVDQVVRMALALTKSPAPEAEVDAGTIAALNNIEAHARAQLDEVERMRKKLA